MRILGIVSTAAVIGGIVLILSGSPIAGVLILLAGLVLGALAAAVSMILRVRQSLREWQSIFKGGGPAAIRVVNITPPAGVVFNRDASVTVEVTGQDGSVKQVQREISIPIPQALIWKLAGKMPAPLARFTQIGDVNLPVYRKRGT